MKKVSDDIIYETELINGVYEPVRIINSNKKVKQQNRSKQTKYEIQHFKKQQIKHTAPIEELLEGFSIGMEMLNHLKRFMRY